MPEEKKNEATLRAVVLAGIGALATSDKQFKALKSKGQVLLEGGVSTGKGTLLETKAILKFTKKYGFIFLQEGEEKRATRVRSGEVPDSDESLPGLIEAMMPQAVPTPAMVLQARRNGAARAAMIEEFGLLTSNQLAEINESAAENRAALASRWKQEGKIFSVTHRGATYYPAFQFAPSGRPRRAIARVLEALGGDNGWETALWFTAANGYLEATRPVDLLDTDPEAVVEAARKDVEVPY